MDIVSVYQIYDRLARLEKVVFETVDTTSDVLARLQNLEKVVFGNATSD